MKDLHSHLLYGIDDGCKTIEESIAIIKQASKEGVTDIMLTPHYIKHSDYNCCNKDKKELFDKLVAEVEKEKININLYLGNEVYITEDFIKLMLQKEITTLNNSKYLLLEFSLNNMHYNAKKLIYSLITNGCVPIIAHPERYRIFQRHPEHLEEYLRMGVLLQGNYKSLFGKYGKDAKKSLKLFLENDWITFLGSDNHHEKNYDLKKLKRKLKSIIKDDEKIEDLLSNNFDKVINDQEIGIKRYKSIEEVK